ncbi:hypothetical protein CLV30_12164 [Haloactinopolyspora alba]|uniref:DUF7847 domain-containing protein n=1 Tax=Haloactinopolyspora alba TaxID=648780 RepID=A0A2P8DL02_9ACTN|nr:hypothetical protein [Haloactinopolyspora alba]PSK97907.1 hypothetical protein CLV30_12164 [Haloactinopolyspora alba]
MSGTAGTPPPDERPDGEPAEPAPQPPYPGWSTEQPSPRGWGAGADPSGSGGWQHPGGSHPSGLPGAGAPQGGAAPGGNGWTGGPEPTWRLPDAKPGVVPLRPLGVGEILDGAVTTIRRNLGAMLGLSAAVAVATQLLSTATIVWMFGDQVTEPNFGLTDDVQELEDVADAVPAALLGSFVTLIATVFLTGVLTVVVGQAVLGRHITVGQAWRRSRGRLLRLLGLTLLYTLVWLSPLLAVLVLAVALAAGGSGAGAAALVVVLMLVAALAGVWLYVRFALSLPALMLESVTGAGGERPIGVVRSLRRSAALVRKSWWRTFAILLLIAFIVWLIGQVVAVPLGVPGLFGGDTAGDNVLTWFILNSLAGMIAATITAPFSAAATALLYVDRRIRREALDIDLARAAGVELPSRPGPGPGPGPDTRPGGP